VACLVDFAKYGRLISSRVHAKALRKTTWGAACRCVL